MRLSICRLQGPCQIVLGQLEDKATGERRVMFPLAEERKIWMQDYVDRISVTRDGLWLIHETTGALRLLMPREEV